LRHVLEITEEADGKVPFEILVGASAGAINLAVLAARAASFPDACELMCAQWEGITTSRVFQTEAHKIARNALRWFFDLTLGGVVDQREPRGKSLVNTEPLAALIRELSAASETMRPCQIRTPLLSIAEGCGSPDPGMTSEILMAGPRRAICGAVQAGIDVAAGLVPSKARPELPMIGR